MPSLLRSATSCLLVVLAACSASAKRDLLATATTTTTTRPPPAKSKSAVTTTPTTTKNNTTRKNVVMDIPSNNSPVVPNGEEFDAPLTLTPEGFKSEYVMINPEVRDPKNGKPDFKIVAVHLVHVPGTNTYLYMERPSGGTRNIAATMNMDTMVWTPVTTPDGLFCCGHTVLADGQVVVVGGHQYNAGWAYGMKSIRLFNPRQNATLLNKTAEMSFARWYPTPTLLASGKVLIMGGTQGVGAGSPRNYKYEIFDPEKPFQMPMPQFDIDPTYMKVVKQNYYPFNFVMPTGHIFNFCGRNGRILDAEKGAYLSAVVPFRPGYAHGQFPYTGTGAMLALDPANNYTQMEVMLFGGNNEQATVKGNENMIAGRWSHRMRITWDATGRTYQFSGWAEEDMFIPRVMGDVVNLPNGDLILMNGAMRGLAGDAGNGGDSRANRPSLWAQLYQPEKPKDSRYTTLDASQVARLYHSVAALTINGTILVSGCDRCWKLHSAVPSFVVSPIRFEYRNEIFYPPYWYDHDNKPKIVAINGDNSTDSILQLDFNEQFTITWTGFTDANPNVPVTGVTLVAPSSVTHSFNANQRVVILPKVDIDLATKTARMLTPPNPYIAPPQMYMMFLLNGKVYGPGRWVHLVDKRGVAKTGPNGVLLNPQ